MKTHVIVIHTYRLTVHETRGKLCKVVEPLLSRDFFFFFLLTTMAYARTKYNCFYPLLVALLYANISSVIVRCTKLKITLLDVENGSKQSGVCVFGRRFEKAQVITILITDQLFLLLFLRAFTLSIRIRFNPSWFIIIQSIITSPNFPANEYVHLRQAKT